MQIYAEQCKCNVCEMKITFECTARKPKPSIP